MKKQELPSLGYRLRNDPTSPNVFVFETANLIIYEVRFKPSGYIFANDPDLEPFVFEISIVVIDNPAGKHPPGDPLIPPTIASIFSLFFEQHERIVVYICDSSDKRGQVRQRKFSGWLTRYGGTQYIQFNDSLQDDSGEIYYLSLLTRSTNPYRHRLMNAFSELIATNRRDK